MGINEVANEIKKVISDLEVDKIKELNIDYICAVCKKKRTSA